VDNDSIWQCEIDRNTANDCEFLLQASDDLDVQKAVGDVLLRVVGGADAGFELDTYNGQILSRLDGCAAAVRRALDRAVPSIAALVTATAVVPAAHTEISAAARRILDHPSSPPKTRRAALAIQLQLPMAHRALPVEILTSALTSRDEAHPRPAAIDRLTAAELLYELVANRAAAGAAIATITTDSTEALYLRRDAREVLTGRGGPRGRTLAAEGLAAEAGDERLSIAARCGAALRSVEIIPGAAGDLTGKLRRLIPGGTGSERVTILGTLLEIDPADEVSLVELIDLMSASGASQRLVAAAANQIADGTPVHRLAGGEVLERILAQPGLSTGFRLRLLGPLIRALPDTIHATVAEVSKIGNDDAEPPVFRARAAVVLCSLESGPAARIGQPMLWAILDDPAAAAHDRVLAGRLLLGFAGPHRRETREIMLSLQGPVEDRLAAAVAVLRRWARACRPPMPALGACLRRRTQAPGISGPCTAGAPDRRRGAVRDRRSGGSIGGCRRLPAAGRVGRGASLPAHAGAFGSPERRFRHRGQVCSAVVEGRERR
jgi:hypothetical protein